YFDGVRFAATWRPIGDLSMRYSMGSSIAPPYLSILNVPQGSPQPNIFGSPTAFLIGLPSGNLKPETAFGYDLGFDYRLRNRTTNLSLDVYRTNLHNQFLNVSFADGTFQGLPLIATQWRNIGHSRYEGIEAALHQRSNTGFGYILQGA